MNREQKIASTEELSRTLQQTPHVILAQFSGLTVNQATELRRKVREAGGSYRVIKNRLAKRAAQGTPAEKLAGHLNGPCAIACHESDPIMLAKTLSTFAKDNPQLQLVAGLIDSAEALDADGLKALAQLPSLPELRAQLLSLIQTPATTLLRLVNTPGEQVARVLSARADQDGPAEA